ncbi:adenylyltransferase/cytidyltransferase family protein [Spirochaeta africana]|uniref:Cytidyltransferase-related enzyme n=1 Tax=Spirochaeta africana (strain ATCC 700263 / DSM 8902 / Z-7692) TaxID=889378 RepID=H9UMV0_SPIAZ|nr:adenylyltransferase/cytidyltransferase family protein [Spirochaeta africana]AFG38843.1 cytidyltransferase-related enzyme [Spirochaeta africana DSM 8902]
MLSSESTQLYTDGIIIGRFMPPHNGHRFLIDFAARLSEQVTIFLCSLPDEPIPGRLRYDWLSELYPGCRIVHFTQAIPAAGRENPNAHRIWADHIRPHMPHGVGAVFASEAYGKPLAAALGAAFVPLDISRGTVPVSGQLIRQSPFSHWDHLPVPVRAYFCKTAVIHCRNEDDVMSVHQAARELLTTAITWDAPAPVGTAMLYAARRQARRIVLVAVPPTHPAPLPAHDVDIPLSLSEQQSVLTLITKEISACFSRYD